MNDETLLTTELHLRADTVTNAPLTFEGVRGRARQIRRRRWGAAAAVAAVVAAIVVPVSLLAGSSGNDDDLQPAPSPTTAVDPNSEGVPTLQDGVIVYPDGRRIPLRLDHQDQILTFAPLGSDQWVLSVGTAEHGTQTVVVNEVGQSVGKYPNGGGMTIADDHEAVAWMDPDGSAQLLVAGTDQPRRLSVIDGANPTPVAITGDCTIECDVIVRSGQQGLGASWAASSTGEVRALPAAVPAVVDASLDGTLLAGLDEYAADDIHVCGGVYDLRTSDFLFHNCSDNVYRFSPDGGLVATTFAEGRGPTGITIRDAHSGSPIASLNDVGWVSSFAWEDDRHLLAVVVADDGATRMERLSVDAPTEVVLDGFTTDVDNSLVPPLILPS
jgi:hypothetical protein